MKNLKFMGLVLFLFVYSSCEEEYDRHTEELVVPPTIELVQANIEGDVQDNHGNAIPDASIRIYVDGALLGVTKADRDGHYVFQNQSVSTTETILTVSDHLSMPSIKQFKPIQNTDNYLFSTVLDVERTEDFVNSATIQIDNSDLSFSIDSENLAIENPGKIQVLSSFFTKNQLQGNTSLSRTTSENRQWLDLMGVLDIRILDDLSQQTSIKDNESFAITIHATIENAEDLTFWYLDETMGTWTEGGSIVSNGSDYIIDVDQLGIIGLGSEREMIEISGQINEKFTQEPIYKALVTVSNESIGVEKTYTTSDGAFKVNFPRASNVLVAMEKEGYDKDIVEISGSENIQMAAIDLDSSETSIFDTIAGIGDSLCLMLAVELEFRPWECSLELFPNDFFKENAASYSNFTLNVAGETYSAATSEGSFNIGFEPENIGVNLPYFLEFLDENNSSSSCHGELKGVDILAPVAIALDSLTVSLDGMNSVKVYAMMINDQSFDPGCSEVTLGVLRRDHVNGDPLEEEFGDYVEFLESEVEIVVDVLLKVTDSSGNSTWTWTTVRLIE